MKVKEHKYKTKNYDELELGDVFLLNDWYLVAIDDTTGVYRAVNLTTNSIGRLDEYIDESPFEVVNKVSLHVK